MNALSCGIPRRQFLFLATASIASVAASPTLAQDAWPAGRVITWVVPYPPGGSTDVLGRSVAQKIAAALHANIIVENRAGATGTIGGSFVAKAPPDGYTLLGTSIGPQAIAPHLMTQLPYEPLRDLEPVITIGTIPHILVVAASQPFRTVTELVAQAKANPGTMSFASGGNGTILQMQGELLKQQAGTQFIHSPYKGDAPALQDTLAGVVNFMFAPAAAALPHIASGKLRALAVTSAQRLKTLPEVPTMREAGYRDFIVEQWQALYAPAKTPASIVARLNTEVGKALKDPAIIELADKLGVTLVGGSPEQLARQQASDSAKWGQLIRDAHITLN